MIGPVDVLAVLADYSAQHGNPEDFEQARAAVAELIEAATEGVVGGCLCDTCERTRAAIARCRGGA